VHGEVERLGFRLVDRGIGVRSLRDRLNGPPGTAGIRQPGYDAEHCSPSIAQVRNAWSYTSTAEYVLMARYVIKHWDKFALPRVRSSCLENSAL
jgi:hypothetical protein